MPRKYTLEIVKATIEAEGWKLLSTKYNNPNTVLEMLCPQGHRADKTFSKFQQGRRCATCYTNITKLTFKFVKNLCS